MPADFELQIKKEPAASVGLNQVENKPPVWDGSARIYNTTTPTHSEMDETGLREQKPLKRWLSSAVVLLGLPVKLAL